MNKNNIPKKIATVAGATVLAGTALGQSKDTLKIQLYEPIPILKAGQAHDFGGRNDSFYELQSISRILSDYDAGKTRPDDVMGDIEMDYFRSLGNVPGFAEYSMTRRDNIAANVMAGALNNVDNGDHVGNMTTKESYSIYTALKKAGYLQNPGDRVKVLLPRTDEVGFGKINGQKAIFPAGNYVRGVIFTYEGNSRKEPCTDCDDDKNLSKDVKKTFNWGPEISVLYVNGNVDMFAPQVGVFGKYGRAGFGITGAYAKNNRDDVVFFPNIQGNGSTTDITTTDKKFSSLGAKFFYDITDRLSLGITGQANHVNTDVGGSVRQIVSDGGPNPPLDQTVAKISKHNEHNYFSFGPEVRVRLNKRLGVYGGARFGNKPIEGAYAGFSYRLGK